MTDALRQARFLSAEQTIDLPTEAEWEFACRAGTSSRWYFGGSPTGLEDHAWYVANSGGKTHAVGLKKPNSWGIYDLYGNVAEWCLDDLTNYQDHGATDPLFLGETGLVKVTRGGDFSCPDTECRSASRGSCHRGNPFNEATGLRVICCRRRWAG